MDAEEAAGLTAVLEPTLAVPHHYAFHSGWLGDRMITKADQDPAALRRRGRTDRPADRRPAGPARDHGDRRATPLARHSTTDAKALVQLVELHAS
jgi:hypothetical protein